MRKLLFIITISVFLSGISFADSAAAELAGRELETPTTGCITGTGGCTDDG